MKQTMRKGRNADPRPPAPAARKPPAKNSEQKSPKQPTKKMKEVSVEKKPPKGAEMVTITKSEFDAILETIGKLSMGPDKLESQATDHQKSIETHNRINSEERERSHHGQNFPSGTGNSGTGIAKGHMTLTEKKRLEWQQENGSAAVAGWHNQDDVQKARSDPRPTWNQRQEYNDIRTAEQNENSTQRFLTAAEKKKLQWQRERAELSSMDRYDPWGRSGGGAPIKDVHGNVVNDYTKRQEVLLSSGNQRWTDNVSNFKNVDPSMVYPSRVPSLQKAQSHPERMDVLGDGFPSSQGAMMSSFRSGALAPDGGRGLSEKERQKLEWLEELEKQREDQRQRKLVEKRERREESPERYYWAEKSGITNRQDEGRGHPPQPAAWEPQGGTRWGDPSNQGQVDPGLSEINRHSAPPLKGQVAIAAPVQNAYNGDGNSTNIRGQNLLIDPVTRQEQEEKRRKYLETQEFNRRQVEEREQQRREEKERRIREDLEDERKFHQMKQTTNPEKATSLPQPATRDPAAPVNKEELERRKEESLRQGLEAARLEAEREKKQRLIEKLRKGNHDVSHLEAKLTTRSTTNGANTSRRPMQEPPRPADAWVPAKVEPSYVPGLGDLSSVPNSGPSHSESHHNNYKDYGQAYRGHAEKTSREFGTQTDTREVSRESTQVEYRLPEPKSNNNSNTKKVRVVSAPKPDHKKPQHERGTASKAPKQQPGQRPMWGYSNTTNKKPMKQSERDAFHGTSERHQRRIDRQNQLLNMMARNADRVPDYRVIPTLSRARSRSVERTEDPRSSHENDRTRKNASRRNRSRSQSRSPVRHNRSQSRSPVRHDGSRSQSHSPIRRNRSHSPVPAPNGTNRSSPPLPSIRRHPDHEVDKYRDRLPIEGASHTNFVPFVRSSNVLNPAHAESPLPMSREPTEMEKARRAYQGVLQPAKYGQRMEPYHPSGAGGTDPLLNPSLVTEHPTQRQGQILQHLSTLRQALREKQKEMNSISETMPDQYGGRRIVTPVYD